MVFSALLCLSSHSVCNRRCPCLLRILSHSHLPLQNDVPNSAIFPAFIPYQKSPIHGPILKGLVWYWHPAPTLASAQRSGSKGPGTVSGCGCAGRCVCWARFCTSQSGSILPGVRHLGASPCSVSHVVGFLCGPFRASVSPPFSWTKKCPGPLCFPLLGLLWFPVPRCMSVSCQLWPAPSKGDYREPYLLLRARVLGWSGAAPVPCMCVCWVSPVVSDSLRPHGL